MAKRSHGWRAINDLVSDEESGSQEIDESQTKRRPLPSSRIQGREWSEQRERQWSTAEQHKDLYYGDPACQKMNILAVVAVAALADLEFRESNGIGSAAAISKGSEQDSPPSAPSPISIKAMDILATVAVAALADLEAPEIGTGVSVASASTAREGTSTSAPSNASTCPTTPPKEKSPVVEPEAPKAAPTKAELAKKKTNQAHQKRDAILLNGTPASRPCTDCVKGNKPCVVWAHKGPVCAYCAGKKLKCEFSEAADAQEITKHGIPASEPCAQCVEKGTEDACIQANSEQVKRFGTACAACQAEGRKQFCNLNTNPKKRNRKVRRM